MTRRRRWLAGITALALAAASVFLGVASPAFAVAAFSIQKTAVEAGPFGPGDPVTYQISVNCSSTNEAGCFNTLISDPLPEPLIFNPANPTPVTVQINPPAGQPAGDYDLQVDTAGNSFTVAPGIDLTADPVLWPAGYSMTITVSAIVDPATDGTWDGATVTNTATATGDNAPDAPAWADILLEVDTTLVPSIAKTVAPTGTIPAVPGQPVDWTVTPGNASNQNVDTIVMQDPVNPPSDFDGYLDVTGYDIVAPPGTESTTTEYYVNGEWTTTEPDPISAAGGIRVTFAGTFAPGASGSVVVHTVTNDTVTDIPDQTQVTVTNDASSTVSKDGTTSDPITDDASITIAQRQPDVTIDKVFEDNTLVSGQSTTANITATVGEQNVQTLTITEPTAGTSTFSEQGLIFNGFGDDVAWPVAATSAQITYTYSDCPDSTDTATAPDTLPDPTPDCTVEGFTVVYSAPGDNIISGAYATIPIDVTAASTDVPVSSSNAVDTEVENTNGQTGTADDDEPFTIEPLTLDTSVTKNINPDQIFGAPGTDADMTLTGNVTPESTAGSDKLVISDPAFPAIETEFWDNFAVTQINNTDIPECTTLTVRYWSESEGDWVDFPGATEVPGPQDLWSYDIPSELQDDIGGIQFEYDPLDAEGCPDELPPGFTVVTHLDLELTTEQDEPITFDNTAQSLVDNPDAGGEHTDTASDSIDVLPIDGGDGVDFLDKEWTPEDDVPALSGETRTARLWWSTQGLNISTMTLSDISETEIPANTDDTSGSVYDAFDLVRIDPITPETDPLVVNDVITEVSLYSDDADDWVDITAQACAAGCDGQFGGYTLTDPQAADTLAVRIVITERTPGAGVGSSYDRRPFDLDFRLRDTLRSDPTQWVLGDLHTYTYNTTSPGRVNNTASAHGVNPATGVDSTDVADDDIQIVDRPVNASMTKTFDQDQLGLPEVEGVDPDDYPLITSVLAATNTSAARVSGMVIDDPTPGQALPDTVFDTLNLYDIDAIQLPPGISADETTVTVTGGAISVEYTYDEALALSPDDLREATAIQVAFRDADGGAVIPTNGTGGITLTWQLRDVLRSDPATPVDVTAPGESIENDAHTQLESPVLDDCADNQCGTGAADASDEFQIVAASYAIETTKTITPDQIYEDESTTYVTQLGGRPNGTARATFFSLTDTTPTFWNTMDFLGAQINVPAPVNEVAMDVLVDDDGASDIAYTEVGGVLVATCNGLPLTDSSPCWVAGEWIPAPTPAIVLLDPPAAVTDETTIVGVRFRAQQVDAEGNVVQWERPFNPQLTFSLTTERREFLRSDPTVLVSTTRPDLQPNPGETDLGVISDDVQSYSTAQFGPDQTFEQSGQAEDTTTVLHRPNSVEVTKTRGSSALISPTGAIPYVITVTNTGQWNMTGFHIVDQVETDAEGSLLVEPDPPAYSFALSGPGAPTGDPGFTASLNEETGELSIDGPADFVFNAGWTLTVNAPLLFRDDVTPDTTVGNEVTVSSDRLFETCQGTTVENGRDLTPKPVENTPPGVPDCSADTEITPLANATIAAKKYVKGTGAGDPAIPGDDDLGVLNVDGDAAACDPSVPGVTNDGFYSYPCAPVTRPGGEETWRVDFTNTGNTSARVLAALDTLPTVGDQGVIVPGDRDSEFPVTLSGTLAANFAELADSEYASYGIYLSPVQLSQQCNSNAISVYTAGATPDPACDFAWELASAATPPATLVAARSVLLVLEYSNPDQLSPAPGLRPGETLRMTYETQTPYVLPANSAVPDGLPVAYNSFATASRSNATVTQPERPSLIVEPQKVGVAAATGQLLLSKVVDAPEFATDVELPDSYPLLVTCTSGGEDVTLLHADGSDASRPSVDADGTVLAYNSTTGPVNLPLFSTCTVIEDPVIPGVTVTVDPEDGVIADRDWSEEPSVWDPYSGDPEQASIQLTNTYAAGGFTVEKSVDSGGAVNQDDEPIVYERTYSFEASCIYLDQETIPEADLEFTLVDGESKTFSNIPAGAECTVTETDSAGAAETSVVVTENGVAGDPTSASEASFTILPYDEGTTTALTLVGFTNIYTTGAVEVTKLIVDPGGWGTADFTVEMSCTLDGVSPNPVFEDSTTLNADNTTWLVGGLPTGAECTVTETETGGANSWTESVTVIVGDDPEVPVEAAITNTFTIGSLEVQKQLEGAPANALEPATTFEYEVSLACTRVVNGETVDVAIPGGATRSITGAGTALYEGLPTGAECTVTETDQGFATGTPIISPDQPVTIGSGDEPVLVTVTNVFENGAVSVEKIVDAPEGFPVPESFTATVTCTWQGADVELENGGVATIVPGEDPVVFPDVPVDSICTIEEEDAGQTGTTVTPETITVTEADQTFEFEVENTYEWASLQVGKLVEADTPFIPSGYEFDVVCTYQGETVVDETFTLDANEIETITEIPARSECIVTETDARGANGTVTEAEVPGADGELAPQIDQETRTVVIPELQPDSTAVVNTVTYTNLFDTTAMVLVKQFEGEGADQFGLDETFTFHITCTFEGETVLDAEVELNAENGFSTAITNMVVGSVCTVVENDLNGADAVVFTPNEGEDPSTATVTVPSGGALVTVTATNWYLTGSLEVTKTFAGDAAEKFGTDDFELTLSCLRDGVAVEIPDGDPRTVSADSPTALWENLPTGSECTLTETDDGGANSTAILDAEGNVVAVGGEGYSFTVETDPTILSVDDQPQPSLQVENTFNFAQVSVTKSVASDAVDQEGQPIVYGPFEVELACVWNGQDVLAAEDMLQTIADGETVTWTELPEGAVCTITETDTSDASSTSIAVTQAGSEGAPVTGTVVELAPLPNVTAEDQTSVAIVNEYEVASLSISKLLDGTAASTVTRTFTVAVTCVFVDASHPEPGQTVFDGEFEIGGPQRLTADIENLPAGTVCTVTETDAGDADSTTMTVDGVVQAGDSGTVMLASGHVAIVFTNTFMAPLPPTGVALAWGIPALALLLLGGGAFAIVIARRRRLAGAEPPQ